MKKTAWKRKPQILIINSAKFLSDTWTTHVQDRIQAAQLRIKELNWDFTCYSCMEDSLGFESSQVNFLLKKKWKRKGKINTFQRNISESKFSKTCHSQCPEHNLRLLDIWRNRKTVTYSRAKSKTQKQSLEAVLHRWPRCWIYQTKIL